MRKILLLVPFIGAVAYCIAQENTLFFFEKKRIAIDKTGVTILGSWAIANMGISAFGLSSDNRQAHYFHEMNLVWNSFNLGIAGLGYLAAKKAAFNDINIAGLLSRQNKSEKTFLFNAGLDLAYIAGGAYLTERAKSRTDPAKLTGYGNAVMVNGAFYCCLT